MTFSDYQAYFEGILNATLAQAPYDNPDYFNYTKLNWSRMNRWLKMGQIQGAIVDALNSIQTPQKWIIITEPWCGDAAHVVPFIEMIARLNPLIQTEYVLRDTPPLIINDYLTNGKSKSIPKLVMRDENGKDLAVWGPRPAACQVVYDELHRQEVDFETLKIALQDWYNKDQGREIMEELAAVIRQID